MENKQRGFSLIELVIVVAIVAVLAAIAVLQYRDYVSRTRAGAAMAELSRYRSAVTECMAALNTRIGCSAGQNGIPSLAPPTRNITNWISITDGEIQVISGATDASGGTGLTIILAPNVVTNALITWNNTGTICNDRRGLRAGQGDCP